MTPQDVVAFAAIQDVRRRRPRDRVSEARPGDVLDTHQQVAGGVAAKGNLLAAQVDPHGGVRRLVAGQVAPRAAVDKVRTRAA